MSKNVLRFPNKQRKEKAFFSKDIELKKQAFVYKHPDVTEAELEDLIQGR
jgi:hypothetical protein